MIEVLSSGGGTQSTAMCALVIQGILPRPDFVVIADTGREMPTTWQYLDAVVRPAMKAIGIEVHRVATAEYVSDAARDAFHQNGDLLMPAFSNQGGGASKLPAFCSNEWKGRVIDRFLSREFGIKRSDYVKWIGFSFDETSRILKMMAGKQFKQGLIRFPLVNDRPTRRQDAIQIVLNHGWPKPPRSRCYDCPNQSDVEWAEVKDNHPDSFKLAIERDEYIRTKDAHAFLHSTIKPLKDADLSNPDDLFSASCPSGECFL